MQESSGPDQYLIKSSAGDCYQSFPHTVAQFRHRGLAPISDLDRISEQPCA